MAQLVCEDLVLGYEGRAVVKDLNFSVEKGDYLCIVGENGSGKSTLIKALLGLKKPMSGTIRREEGLETSGIGYLPQQTAVQRDFPVSVREIVLSGCLCGKNFHPFYRNEEKKLARENMDRLGILHLEKRCYRELSGGQQQRVLLARALCAAREMLLLDEPVAGLDPLAMQEMYALLEQLNREEKITMIMVSHDIKAAADCASHILHVGEHPLFFGTSEDYRNSEIGRAYLSVKGGASHA